MNRIDQLFQHKNREVLSVYFTAGFPHKSDTGTILKALQQSGADIAEVGFPYSDPLADGPTIQRSSQQAINNGVHLDLIFEQLQEVKAEIHMPVILMGYLNMLYHYGAEEFCRKSHDAGVSGVIIPDLPPEEYERDYQNLFAHYGLHAIFLISPQTPDERVRYVAGLSRGFLYLVSQAGTTGLKGNFEQAAAYFDRIRKLELNIPLMAGFGISDAPGFNKVCRHLHGGIIGSAFIRALENGKNPAEATRAFIASIREG